MAAVVIIVVCAVLGTMHMISMPWFIELGTYFCYCTSQGELKYVV